MKVLNAWKATLEKETEGRLKLRFYPGGSQGDERDFVRKMRVGQLDGGVVTMTGMSMLVRPMVILVLPDFLDTYDKLDRVRLKMAKEFEKMFDDEGFMMVAWGDAGKTRLFSQKQIERAVGHQVDAPLDVERRPRLHRVLRRHRRQWGSPGRE